MNNAPLVLVIGATGSIGHRVVTSLISEGYQIRTLSLHGATGVMWPDSVESQIGDITNPAAVHSAMEGVDMAVHLAALLHIINPTPDLRQKYEEINVGGTNTVVEAAIRSNVRRLLFSSTIAVYGDSGGRILDERTVPRPQTFYAQTKLSAEQIVLSAKNHFGHPLGTALRIGAVYGSKIKGNYREMLKALANGRFIPIGHGRNRRTLIYDRDVGRAIVLALSHPVAAGRVYNVTDGKFHTLNQIIASICGALGRRPPKLSIPVAWARFLAAMMEDGARLIGHRSPITRSTVDKYAEDIAVSGKRIREELGFIPRYDLNTGWQETIREMRESHVL